MWVFLSDERRGLEVPDEWVSGGQFRLPPVVAPTIASFTRESEPPMPAPERVYRKRFPEEHEFVVSETASVGKGEPLGGEGATRIPYVDAVVFDQV